MEKTKIINWLKSNWILVIILVVGAFLRLYKINQYMTFLGDEGRDAIIVRNLLVHADPILIGPGTSVGGMYLGPLYYYFMTPFLLLSNMSPVGPAIGIALLGIATIYLVYLTGSEWFSKKAGLISALLFAISPTVIIYSHSSWNPNIMPFFALLSIYSIWKVWKYKKYNWLLVTAFSFAFVLQSHYLGILIAPVLFLYWFLAKVPKKVTFISLLIFSFLMSPLLIFDIRHNWMNSRALYKFLTVRQETVSIKPWTAIPKSYPIFEQINASMLTAKNEPAGQIVTAALSIELLFLLLKINKVNKNKSLYIITIWLVSGLIGFGIYKQHIYDHYFGFLFAIPFLLLGVVSENLSNNLKSFGKYVVGAMILYLVAINLQNSPLLQTPNNQLQRASEVSNKVLEVVDNKPFNLAVLAEQNYEDGYRYFMDLKGAKVLHADIWNKESIADTLMVICEKEESKCDPTHSPKAEVANFGWSKIENSWKIDGVIIYKLVHNYPENK